MLLLVEDLRDCFLFPPSALPPMSTRLLAPLNSQPPSTMRAGSTTRPRFSISWDFASDDAVTHNNLRIVRKSFFKI